MTSRRKSKQREIIFAAIASSDKHPTAQSIYDSLKQDMPSLSLGNLYRNLNILVEEGRIKRRDFGDGVEHYDAILEIHYHFICDSCGKVIDFDMPVMEHINFEAKKMSQHEIKGHTVQFFGICESCKNNGRL